MSSVNRLSHCNIEDEGCIDTNIFENYEITVLNVDNNQLNNILPFLVHDICLSDNNDDILDSVDSIDNDDNGDDAVQPGNVPTWSNPSITPYTPYTYHPSLSPTITNIPTFEWCDIEEDSGVV